MNLKNGEGCFMADGKILIVEDEIPIRKLIHFNLQRSNFEVIEAGNGTDAIKLVKEESPSLVLLDIMLPDMDGFEICTKLRENYPGLPIVIVSARGQDMEKIMALELGADDYVVKPFNPLELVARIRSVLRRTNGMVPRQPSNLIKTGPFVLDLKTQKLYKYGQIVKLTAREYQLIKLFFDRPEEPITRDQLLDEIWGLNYFGDPKTVDVHIRRLREKIEEDPSQPMFLKTIWGFGYCFQESEFVDHEKRD
jgi:DNA-binding response OmpR family regulator